MFDAYDLISLWERDRELAPAEKAAVLLAALSPGASAEALGAMTLGQRDRALLIKRRELFGESLEGTASCAECGEQLEISMQVSDFLNESEPADAPAPASSSHTMDLDGTLVTFRLPTTDDATLVSRIPNRDDARSILVLRCILSATRDGEEAVLDEDQLDRVAERMEALDPLSEIQLDLRCAECKHEQAILLDIGLYLWSELVAEARCLLDDVRALAQEYGWREADILAMSGARRKFYLDRSRQ